MAQPSLGPRTVSNAPGVPGSRPTLKPLSTEGSIIPGETEEDGLLRREYVLVGDTQAVEFNRAVDGACFPLPIVPVLNSDRYAEINAARRRPLIDRRVPPTPASANDEKRSPDLLHHFTPDSQPTPIFPPPPNPGSVPSPMSRTATNALSRALTLASKKLFGASVSIARSPPHFIGYGEGVGPHSPRMRTTSLGGTGEVDPVEDELLGALEQLAQKTHVIMRWADEMYEFVKSVPQSAFHASPHSSVSVVDLFLWVDIEPLPDPSKFTPREGENEKLAARRRNADVQAEYNAVTCIAIYMLVMQFAQKGIDELRKYQEHMEMRHPEGDFVVSEGFDEGASDSSCRLAWNTDREVQRSDGSGTSFCGVMIVRRSLRRGCLRNIRARAPGSTSSCTTARSPSYVNFFSFPRTKTQQHKRAESHSGAQGTTRPAQVTGRVRAPVRRVALVSVRAAG